jgi:hypothetical protein
LGDQNLNTVCLGVLEDIALAVLDPIASRKELTQGIHHFFKQVLLPLTCQSLDRRSQEPDRSHGLAGQSLFSSGESLSNLH